LLGDDVAPERRQMTELPPIQPEVTEYRRHALTCLVCQHKTEGAWPADLPSGSFGPRLQGTVGYFTGRLGVSQRDVEEVMDTLFHADVSLGSIPALELDVSAALVQPVEAVQTYVRAQPVVNADETSWREGTARHWLWLAATPWVASFLVLATRGTKGAQQLLGAAYQGIVGSDRWSGYNWLATRCPNCAGPTSSGISRHWSIAAASPLASVKRLCSRPASCSICGIASATAP
jgi:hypothetical protein